MSTTNLKTTTKQQEQIKRTNKIYFREQRTNQCQQTKRWAVLAARFGGVSVFGQRQCCHLRREK